MKEQKELQEKASKLESTISQKNIPQADKKILIQEVEKLKQILTKNTKTS